MVQKKIYKKVKRVLDFIGAVFASAFLLIPILFIALAVKLTSKGPVIHWSKRIGINNKNFKMAKFRTMKVDTPQIATHLMENPDSYLTYIGRILRKFSLDELPQLINILNGDLSFVGPRPALYNQDDLKELRTKEGIETVVPGLTGWAQINGRDDLPIPIKVKYDKEYCEKRSLLFDFKIIILTFFSVIRREGINH